MRWPAVALAGALALPSRLPAQSSGGPFIPIGTRLDQLTSWAVATGSLHEVDPLTRPYRLSAVRAAALRENSVPPSRAAATALAWLRDELALIGDSTAIVVEAGLTAYRSGNRDAFRPQGSSGSAPSGGVWVSLARGPFVAVMNPAFDNRLKDDPSFSGKADRFIAGRLQHGYVALTGSLGDLVLGRTPRHWGPGLFDGLQLSPSAYATDQLVGTLRLGRFELTTMAQRLDDYDSATAAIIDRWFLAHRLTIQLGSGSWLALSETGVYGGPGRGFEPALHMPLGPALLAQWNERRDANLLWGAETHIRLAPGLSLEAQLVIDDLQIDATTASDSRPASGGASLVVNALLPRVPVLVSLGYTRVQSLTYRNSFEPWTIYALNSVGIGRNFSDYDEVRLQVEGRPRRTTMLAFEAAAVRQGSGDFRDPFPSDSVLALPGQGFLVDPVQRTVATRLIAALEPAEGVQLRGELGVIGGDIRRGIASLSAQVRYDFWLRRRATAWRALF